MQVEFPEARRLSKVQSCLKAAVNPLLLFACRESAQSSCKARLRQARQASCSCCTLGRARAAASRRSSMSIWPRRRGTLIGPLNNTRHHGRSCLLPRRRVCPHQHDGWTSCAACNVVALLSLFEVLCAGAGSRDLELLLVDEAQLISATDVRVWRGIRALHHGQPPRGVRPLRVIMASTYACRPGQFERQLCMQIWVISSP